MNVVIIALCAVLLLSAVRLFIGPTVHDRLTSLNVVGGMVVILMATLSLRFGGALYLDVALIYAVLSFIGIIAVAGLLRGSQKKAEGE